MSHTLETFLNLLLDDKPTCYARSATGVLVHSKPDAEDIFFSINALNPELDLNPTASYHAIEKPRRADHNVTCFRNFLIEIDSMPLNKQIEYVTSKIPVSSIVYSGGKSYHFIISLDTPLENIEQYRALATRLHMLLPESDSTTKNPSRLSRLPFRLRPDTKKFQSLEYLGTRIPLETLIKILPPEKVIKKTDKPSAEYLSVTITHAVMHPEEAMNEMDIQGRNHFFFWLGCRLQDLGLAQENKFELVQRAYGNLNNKSSFDLNEALFAARVK